MCCQCVDKSQTFWIDCRAPVTVINRGKWQDWWGPSWAVAWCEEKEPWVPDSIVIRPNHRNHWIGVQRCVQLPWTQLDVSSQVSSWCRQGQRAIQLLSYACVWRESNGMWPSWPIYWRGVQGVVCPFLWFRLHNVPLQPIARFIDVNSHEEEQYSSTLTLTWGTHYLLIGIICWTSHWVQHPVKWTQLERRVQNQKPYDNERVFTYLNWLNGHS